MGCVVAREGVLLKRKLSLQKIFRPISPTQNVQTFSRSFGQQFAVGLGADNFGTSLRQARHRTRNANIFLNYFEAWVPNDGVEFVLERAYLHLDEPRSDGADVELLALHCDPETSPSDAQYKYKRGPHFHIAGLRPNFSKAHIATCITSLDHTCSSLEALTSAIAAMVEMINDEILERL